MKAWLLSVVMCLFLVPALAQESPFNLGVEAARQGKHEVAIGHFQKAVADDPRDSRSMSWLGFYLKTGKATDAIACLKKATELNPRAEDALNNLGNAYTETGQVEKAIEAYQAALKIKEDYYDAHYNLGNAYIALGKGSSVENAIKAFKQALSLQPNSAEAHNNNLGLAYARMAQTYVAARDRFEAANDKEKAERSLNLGTRLYGQAADEYRAATQADPSNGTYWLNLALAHRELLAINGTTEARQNAISALKKAVSLRQSDYLAHLALADLYSEGNLLTEAISMYSAAARLKPEEFDPHYRLGILYFKTGAYEPAIAAYTKALQIRPNDPSTLNNLGCVPPYQEV